MAKTIKAEKPAKEKAAKAPKEVVEKAPLLDANGNPVQTAADAALARKGKLTASE